jgi:ribose-phosphate pyrophosphokinase
MITCGTTAQSVAAEVSRAIEEPLVDIESDGTVAATGDQGVSADERVVIIVSTTSDRAHLELLELQERALKRDPEELITILPYMGYARQDKVFEPGEPVSSRAIAKAISASTDRVYTVNPHKEHVLDFFDVPTEALDATPRLAGALPSDLTRPAFLSPDKGATSIARSVRNAYGSGTVDNFVKHRKSATDVEMSSGDVEVSGRDIILVDDMISTGGTMQEAVSILHEQNAKRIYVTCVHPVLADKAVSKVYQAGVEEIHATDTIDRSVSRLSTAPVIADVL